MKTSAAQGAAGPRPIVVAAPDYLTAQLGPPLLRLVVDDVAMPAIELVAAAPSSLAGLETGTTQLWLGPASVVEASFVARSARVVRSTVREERIVGIVAADSPRDPADLATFQRMARVSCPLSPALRAAPMPDDGGVLSGSSIALCWIVASTESVALVPEPLARFAAHLPVRRFVPPLPLDADSLELVAAADDPSGHIARVAVEILALLRGG